MKGLRNAESLEILPVVAAQSAAGTKPDKAFGILFNGMNVIVGNSVVHVQHLKIFFQQPLCPGR